MAKLVKIRRSKSKNWADYFEDFVTYKLAQGVTERTIKDYDWHINHFSKDFPEV